MIDLAKETDRVQFVLSSKPTRYEGLDHLQPIFEEMRPPVVTTPWIELMKIMMDGLNCTDDSGLSKHP